MVRWELVISQDGFFLLCWKADPPAARACTRAHAHTCTHAHIYTHTRTHTQMLLSLALLLARSLPPRALFSAKRGGRCHVPSTRGLVSRTLRYGAKRVLFLFLFCQRKAFARGKEEGLCERLGVDAGCRVHLALSDPPRSPVFPRHTAYRIASAPPPRNASRSSPRYDNRTRARAPHTDTADDERRDVRSAGVVDWKNTAAHDGGGGHGAYANRCGGPLLMRPQPFHALAMRPPRNTRPFVS